MVGAFGGAVPRTFAPGGKNLHAASASVTIRMYRHAYFLCSPVYS